MSDCRHETIVQVIGDPRSPRAHVCECGHVIHFAKRCTVSNGRRYIDGVDVGPADPGATTQRTQNSMARGGRTRTGRGKR
jgi:hypothetical protein